MRFELIWGLYIPLLQILSILICRLLSFPLPSHPYSSLHFRSFSFLFFPFLSLPFQPFPSLLYPIISFLSLSFHSLPYPSHLFPIFLPFFLLWYLNYRFALILCCRIIYSLLTSATSPHRLKYLLLTYFPYLSSSLLSLLLFHVLSS